MAVSALPDEYQTIARLYWIESKTCVAISIRTYYSERHVRRLRDAARVILLSDGHPDA